MINALFSSTTDVAMRKMLDVTALRHQAISSNLAHLEQPNYKRLDVNPSFEQEFKSALNSAGGAKLQDLEPHLAVDDSAVAMNKDGNTVQLDKEMMALGDNSMTHSVETQLLTSSLLRLRLAITGHSS